MIVGAPSGSRSLRSISLLFEPGKHLRRPAGSVLAEAFAAEVDTLPIAVAEVSLQGITVRARLGDTVLAERCLRRSNLFAPFVSRHVLARLSHEPGSLPADGLTGVANQLLQIFAVERAGSVRVGSF